MKSEHLRADAGDDQRLLLFLEGSMAGPERAALESELTGDPDLAGRLEAMRHILDRAGPRSAARLSQAEIGAIAENITRRPRRRRWRRPAVLGFAGTALAAALLFWILTSDDTTPPAAELDWDNGALWTLSRDVSLAGMALDDGSLHFEAGGEDNLLENTDRSLLQLRLRLARLEASLESRDERIFP